jgi:osmotically-inducible protein OsmY
VKPFNCSLAASICTTSILSVCVLCGCSTTSAVRQHPDKVESVNKALAFNGFSNVKVWQSRTKGVMTLTGAVASPDEKAQAANIASVNATGYTIADYIAVTPPAGQVKPASDSQIKDKYQTMLQAHKDLERQNIDCNVNNGTIVLSGMVHSAPERMEAVKLAKSVPNVQHVVDEIKVQS